MNDLVKRPLPSTIIVDREANRRATVFQNLNDNVEKIHIALLKHDDPKQSEKYIRLLDAVSDGEAVEGSLAIDNAMAAQMIRDYAKEVTSDRYTGDKPLSAIVRSLNVVLRRYHQSRKERAVSIGGETVTERDHDA